MKKSTFWCKDIDGENRHLRFVISDEDPDGNHMVVHMTTYKNTGREDPSCILAPGDHVKVKNKSFIRYDKAIELSSLDMVSKKFKGEIVLLDEISESTLKKIQEGAKISDALPIKFEKYFDFF